MKWFILNDSFAKNFFVGVFVAVLFFMGAFPAIVSASNHSNPSGEVGVGLVTCGGVAIDGATGITGTECNFCTFIALVNNIITWLFSILAIVAILVLVVAGLRLVTSGGNPEALTKAKSMFTNVIIGFVIVLSAWLIVDTIMKALVQDTDNFGVWNALEVSCGGQIPKS